MCEQLIDCSFFGDSPHYILYNRTPLRRIIWVKLSGERQSWKTMATVHYWKPNRQACYTDQPKNETSESTKRCTPDVTGGQVQSKAWMKEQNSDTSTESENCSVCVLNLVPQNKWPQFVWTGKLAVCRQTGQCQSRPVDGHDCVDS